MLILNPVVLSVTLMLIMCALRINVIISITTAAMTCGLISGLPIREISQLFSQGLGGGAKIAVSYAVLGAFATALSHSGMPTFVMSKIVRHFNLHSDEDRKDPISNNTTKNRKRAKFWLFLVIGLMSIACKNIIPVHIAFIPILIPPLLDVFNNLKIDRRAVACLINYGLIITYMTIPMGFGTIFLEDILSYYLKINGISMPMRDIVKALSIPAIGMTIGLFIALWRYKKPRIYEHKQKAEYKYTSISRKNLLLSIFALICASGLQIFAKDIILSGVSGLLVLSLGGIVNSKESDNIVANGVKTMAVISVTMMAAAGFGRILRESGSIDEIVSLISSFSSNKCFVALMMFLVGALISLGIGSSFSTVPIIASLYVPLGVKLGFSPAAITILVAVAGVPGDSSSPASSSTLGPTIGLNSDGQHSLIKDTIIPAFWHIAIPVFLGGWAASVLL